MYFRCWMRCVVFTLKALCHPKSKATYEWIKRFAIKPETTEYFSRSGKKISYGCYFVSFFCWRMTTKPNWAILFLMLITLFSFFPHVSDFQCVTNSLICVSFLRVAQIADAIAVTETTSSSLSSSANSSRSSTPKVTSCYSEKHQIVLFWKDLTSEHPRVVWCMTPFEHKVCTIRWYSCESLLSMQKFNGKNQVLVDLFIYNIVKSCGKHPCAFSSLNCAFFLQFFSFRLRH